MEAKYLQLLICDFIDVGFDDLGRREYVARKDFSSAMESKQPLPIHSEDEVKQVRRRHPTTVLWMASYCYSSEGFHDYNIVEELCFGSNKLIISNEAILLAPPASRQALVFDNIALIVNCNLPQPPPYTVTPKKVICHPLHTLSRAQGSSDPIFYSINEAIWAGLQTGNVVVHCLAGVHRAACVVVSHALYRHYKLRHTHISNDIAELYRKLASIRRGVAPLGYLALVSSFRDSLEKQLALQMQMQLEKQAEISKEGETEAISPTKDSPESSELASNAQGEGKKADSPKNAAQSPKEGKEEAPEGGSSEQSLEVAPMCT